MITVTFDNKLTEQFENYGDVVKWISDELSANSASYDSDNRVKLELLTKEEVAFLADDQKGMWSMLLEEYSYFSHVVYNGDIIVDVIGDINYCTYADVMLYLDSCDISELFFIIGD